MHALGQSDPHGLRLAAALLLGERYAASFKELMEETNWDSYGTGKYEKCANCMVHCGFEATAVEDAFNHPMRALGVALRGIRTKGPMAPDIPLHLQRPAEYVFSRHVEQKLAEISEAEGSGNQLSAAEYTKRAGQKLSMCRTADQMSLQVERVDQGLPVRPRERKPATP
jgi:Domain of unknown function (DUF3463)